MGVGCDLDEELRIPTAPLGATVIYGSVALRVLAGVLFVTTRVSCLAGDVGDAAAGIHLGCQYLMLTRATAWCVRWQQGLDGPTRCTHYMRAARQQIAPSRARQCSLVTHCSAFTQTPAACTMCHKALHTRVRTAHFTAAGPPSLQHPCCRPQQQPQGSAAPPRHPCCRCRQQRWAAAAKTRRC